MNGKVLLKRQRVLRRLLQGPLHRFQAECAPVHDHCLPSTISNLHKEFGLSFHVRMVRLVGYAGRGVYVAEYALDKESLDLAKQIEAHNGDDAPVCP